MTVKVGVLGATPDAAATVRGQGCTPVSVVLPGTPVEPLVLTDRGGYAYAVDYFSPSFDGFVTEVLGTVGVSTVVAATDEARDAAAHACLLLDVPHLAGPSDVARLREGDA